MRILVTGGAGFIGSNFVKLLQKSHSEYESVIVLDNLTYAGNIANIQDFNKFKNFNFVKGNILDKALVNDLVSKCDVIINFAAESHVDRSIDFPASFVSTNIQGVQILLDAAVLHGVQVFLQVSTDEVYGSIISGSWDESSPLKPNSPYSASKASADLLALAYHRTYGLDVRITRSSNNFGPHQFPEKIIPLFITNALLNKNLPLYGTGKNIRDWIYVEDNCAAIELVLLSGHAGEVYNIGGENELTNFELTKQILLKIKTSSKIVYVDDRKGHDYRYSVNSTKIKSELGFKLKSSFDQAMNETIEWYESNQSWWKDLNN